MLLRQTFLSACNSESAEKKRHAHFQEGREHLLRLEMRHPETWMGLLLAMVKSELCIQRRTWRFAQNETLIICN
jgi:hypothetical protein